MASNARNLSKLLGTSTQVPTTALPQAIADLETIGTSLSGGDIAPKNISSNTLTQSFDSNQTVNFIMSDSIDTISPIISVFKEVPQPGVSSKGNWDVNANATNYEFFDEKSISYSNVTLTPSATGDGTFTSSNATETSYDILNSTAGATSTFTAPMWKVLAFDTNGTKLITWDPADLKLKSYNLSTAWDITTISTSANAVSSISTATIYGTTISADGTRLVGWNNANGTTYEYSMSTPFDVTTLSEVGSASLGISNSYLWFIKPGTYDTFYVVSNRTLYKYTFTGGSITTGTVTQVTGSLVLDPTNQKGYINNGMQFKPDGTEFYIGQGTDQIIEKWTLSTPWDITTGSKSSDTASYTTVGNIWLKPDGKRMYYIDNADSKKVKEIIIGSTLAFNAADVGKKVVGNSGSAVITSTAGAYTSITPFADTSAISSWQLYGAEGKSNGTGISLTAVGGGYDLSNASYTTISPLLAQSEGYEYMHFKPDGTKVWIGGPTQDTIYEYDLSTGFDLSTITYGRSFAFSTSTQSQGFFMKSDGTRAYISDYTGDIRQLDLSTAWDITTASYSNVVLNLGSGNYSKDIYIKPDGTKLYNVANNNVMKQFTMTTPWDLSTATLDHTVTLADSFTYGSITFNSDGTILFIAHVNTSPAALRAVNSYSLSTAWDISSTLTLITNYDIFSQIGGHIASGISFNTDGTKMFIMDAESTTTSPGRRILEYSTGSILHPYSQYFPALTNSSNGQINSSTWLDINSMTADETKNGGDIFYAVSTDNRTSWGVAKASDGVRKIARNNSGTWQYNNDAGTTTIVKNNISLIGDANTNSGSYKSISAQLSPGGANVHKPSFMSPDGTRFYIQKDEGGNSSTYTSNKIYEYSLSTPYDASTISATGASENINFWDGQGNRSIVFSPDGTKLWSIGGTTNSYVYRFNLGTAWTLSTSVQVDGNESNNNNARAGRLLGSGNNTPGSVFGPGGNHIYIGNGASIIRYPTSSAYHINGDLTSDQSVTISNLTSDIGTFNGFDFNSDGTKLFIASWTGNPPVVGRFSLSTPYDLTTMSYDSDMGTYTLPGYEYEQSGNAQVRINGVHVRDNDQRLYIWDGEHSVYMHSKNRKLSEWTIGSTQILYATSETWVDGTNNNEHATLQQALTSQSFNRMNKAQLDAVADGYHFSQDSADTLDLMIAPYAASGASPVSDGVTINYDAEALVREAIAGTDYIAEFPSPNRLDIKSLINGNLKIRAQ